MKRTIIITAIVVAVAVIAMIVISKLSGKGDLGTLIAEVQQGDFEIVVTTTGELQAEVSTDIRGPEGLASRNMRFGGIKIQDLVPEGTEVREGDYVAQLDRTTYDNALKDAETYLKTLQDNLLHRRGVGIIFGGRDRVFPQDCVSDLNNTLAAKRDRSSHQFVKNDSPSPDIGPGVDVLGLDLLGRHVLGRPDHDAGAGQAARPAREGDSEIHDPDVPLAVDHDVLGLEVAVDDADPVGLVQALGDLAADGDGLGLGQVARAADEALEVLAADELHGDEGRESLLADVEHAADVAVGDLAGELDLVPETLDRLRVRCDLGLEELEGDLFLDPGVVDLVDAAHPALAQLLDDLVAAGEGRAPGQLGVGRRLDGPGVVGPRVGRAQQRTPALPAIAGVIGVVVVAIRATHNSSSSPSPPPRITIPAGRVNPGPGAVLVIITIYVGRGKKDAIPAFWPGRRDGRCR